MSVSLVNTDTIEYLRGENIQTPHCFTTRKGGVSQGVTAGLNIGYHRETDKENVAENYRRLAAAVGFDPSRLVLANQVHGNLVRAVTDLDAGGLDHLRYPECDALITNTPGMALYVSTADCTPILLWDPVTGAVGAAHAGWRGTAAGIAGKTVRAMVREFGCKPQDIHAAIGPNAGICHFETDADVPQAMLEAYGPEAEAHIRPQGNKYYVNLKAINALSLRREGVQNISVSNLCTMCQPDLFWSHRITKGQRGAQGGIIVCKEGKA